MNRQQTVKMTIHINNDTEENLDEYYNSVTDISEAAAGSGFNGEISITFVDCEVIKELNRDYRGIDEITDVLSFGGDLGPDGVLYGDIFICYNQAVKQAKEIGNTTEQEIVFLAVHVMLHLMGYDHGNEADERVMIAKQKEIINNK